MLNHEPVDLLMIRSEENHVRILDSIPHWIRLNGHPPFSISCGSLSSKKMKNCKLDISN